MLLVLFISVFFSSSWYQRLVAAFNCGTAWTFLLTFFITQAQWNDFSIYDDQRIVEISEIFSSAPISIKCKKNGQCQTIRLYEP